MLGTSVPRNIINTLPLDSEEDGLRGGELSDSLNVHLPISVPFFAVALLFSWGEGPSAGVLLQIQRVSVGESGRPAALHIGTWDQLHSPSAP